MADTISWVATAATVLAALITASNLGARITGYGFGIFLVGSLAWTANGLMTDQPALTWTNVLLTGLNLFGMWRWLGRQAGVEEGARSAVEASRQGRAETLIPVSLLGSAPVACRDGRGGTCVEGMAGCASGTLAYVVVSRGGVAGVGETLRRLPWSRAEMRDGELITPLSLAEFERLPEVDRDDWTA